MCAPLASTSRISKLKGRQFEDIPGVSATPQGTATQIRLVIRTVREELKWALPHLLGPTLPPVGNGPRNLCHPCKEVRS